MMVYTNIGAIYVPDFRGIRQAMRRISGIKSAHKAEIILVTVKKISHNIRITGGD